MQQAIIWVNDGLGCWCIYASFRPNEFRTLFLRFMYIMVRIFIVNLDLLSIRPKGTYFMVIQIQVFISIAEHAFTHVYKMSAILLRLKCDKAYVPDILIHWHRTWTHCGPFFAIWQHRYWSTLAQACCLTGNTQGIYLWYEFTLLIWYYTCISQGLMD